MTGAPNITTRGSAFVSRFTVDPAKKEDFVRTFEGLRSLFEEAMKRDANLVFYGWARNPNEWVAIESWRSEDAVNAVRATAQFQVTVGKLLGFCTADMQMEVFSGMHDPAARAVFGLYVQGKSSVHPNLDAIGTVFL